MGPEPTSCVIVGAGGHARVVAEALPDGCLVGHLAPPGEAPSASELGPRLGDDRAIAHLAAEGRQVVIGFGFVDRRGAHRRAELLDELAAIDLLTVRHDTSTVSPSASIGVGTFVGPMAMVGTGVTIGRAVIVNSGAIVDHDCRIGDNVHIGPGAVLSGDVSVGDHTLVGVGATIRQGIRIGSGVVVGAGAVVVDDLPDGVTAVGVPARAVESV